MKADDKAEETASEEADESEASEESEEAPADETVATQTPSTPEASPATGAAFGEFFLALGHTQVEVKDDPEATNDVYTEKHWRGKASFGDDINAAFAFYKDQIARQGYKLSADDNSEGNADGQAYSYRSVTAYKYVFVQKYNDKRESDIVTVELIKGANDPLGLITLDVVHRTYPTQTSSVPG